MFDRCRLLCCCCAAINAANFGLRRRSAVTKLQSGAAKFVLVRAREIWNTCIAESRGLNRRKWQSMSSARESAIRLLQLAMIAAVILPAAMFAYASWLSYRDIHQVADERILRSLDVLQEQALKVFETVDRTFAEVNEIVRGETDDDIRAQEPRLHERLAAIVATMPQLHAILLVGREGRPLATSLVAAVPDNVDFSDRDYFQAQREHDAGTYVSDMRSARLPGIATDFFNLSRRLESPDGTFNGVISIAVQPRYFEDFYALIGRTPGSFYALVRADGSYLARYPAAADRSRRLGPASMLRTAIGQGLEHGLYTVNSQIDGVPRRIGFRKLPGFPVFAQAGISSEVMQAAWLASMERDLLFGVPATLLILAVLWVALRRTQRLYEEADRREAAEGALRQSQRLEAVGQLTGGVAHDFNNLLMIVSGSVHRLRRELSDAKQVRLLDAISNATQRGESLTRQLLSFSRRQTLQPSVIDLGERLPELKEMLSRSLRGDIEIRLQVTRRPCLIKADPSELELALLNLAFNARDAMPTGGTLTIAAKPIVLRGKAGEEGLSGEFVAIRVADTGEGIPPDVLPRVFEPFFTTKDIGKGTGLGLSQVYGFARQSGGAATITSTLRRGTAITLFLPRSFEQPAQQGAPPVAAAPALPAGTVLLIEDNADVVEVARGYFADLGFRVKEAASAEDGLHLMERGADIDIVFSDILMPGRLTGLELAKLLRRNFPRVVVLLTTGYSSSAQDAVREGFEVLQKPYDLAALERALLAALKAAGQIDGCLAGKAAGVRASVASQRAAG
jgi:two-component system, NtrC family, sensor kinase